MAAVSSSVPVLDPDSASASAVRGFLQRAIALYHDVLALHGDGDGDDSIPDESASSPDQRLGSHAALIGDSLSALKSVHHVAAGVDAPLPLSTLPGACYKIGQDLMLHFDKSANTQDHESQTKFGDVWSIRDIATLGARLQELSQRFHDDVDSTFVTRRLPVPDLTPLDQKKDEAEEDRDAPPKEDEEESDKGKQKMRRINIVPGDNVYIEVPVRHRPTPDSIVHDYILDVLSYKSMYFREQEVTKAHSKTFEWVFLPSLPTNAQDPEKKGAEHPFSTWLRGAELGPIYWITGKPGSGKSTFIRFLFDHEATMERLNAWAVDKPVLTAGFFFWTSGSREQRSQTGLLRSLLHQILSVHPELTTAAFPQLWKKLKKLSTKERVALHLDWSVADLLEAFQGVMDEAVQKMNVCLFIDGLDEFEGDHTAIIDFFKNLCLGDKGRSIKICLSSRPWAVFQDAFEYAVPNLRLQDLTYGDMHRYTKDRLRENVYIRRLLKHEAAAGEELIQNAVQKADGVFLWVRLALNEMIRKFDQSTGLAGLSGVLQALPTELNELFNLFFFENQDEDQLAEAAVVFGLMNAREFAADFINNDSANALTVWELAFALRGSEDDEAAISEDVKQASTEMAYDRCGTTIQLIMSRFSGLLGVHASREQGSGRGLRFAGKGGDMSEAIDAAARRVTYIHRTVRDWFMEEPGVMTRLVEKTPLDFDPHLRLLRSYVLQMKNALEEIEHHRQLDEWWPGIALAMTHARYVRNDSQHLQRAIVNEVDRTISWYWLSKPEDPYDHWARYGLGPYRIFKVAAPLWQPFLCLATRFGLTSYVCEEVLARNAAEDEISDEKKELQTAESTPLLAYATEFPFSRNKTIFPLSDPRLVDFLLRNQCRINPGPNHAYTDFWTNAPRTPWITLLRHLRDARRRGWIEYYDVDPQGTARWAEIVRLFVEVGGADREAVVVRDSFDPEITALGVLELLEGTYRAVEMRELVEMMVRLRGD
ncbi:hypothetical protein H0G86_012089 [Trichoderma simmonsii]|uniref:NACHT domain-containing protein n=1 Tax=Trichoderma simmonsii TaxID=1491479 RepID=A0A8G0PMZ4_9HYPO|nr:hypothetical protein H0G86_012089 [Trichoderma simmonsii]